MGNGLAARAAVQVARVFGQGTFVGMTDRQVLERFVESQDELAFEAMLERHGPMVRNVCRQILFDPHDVDDAVQAVFLALVRKARFIRIEGEGSLGPWLYTVAGRVAARARAKRRRRRSREPSHRELPEPSYDSDALACEIPGIIHDELGRLPERLRAPLVLCYFQGLTHERAARELACPVGTVRSRLARGRSLLKTRVTRRGLTLSAAALGGMLESNARAAAASRLPEPLADSIRSAAFEAVRHNGIGLSISFATSPGGMFNVTKFKKIAVLATVFSAGALACALVERSKVAGQTQATQSPTGITGIFNSEYDPRPLGPDGRRIGSLPRRDGKTPYPRRYVVRDIVMPAASDQKGATNASSGDGQSTIDMTALVDLLEITVAQGTWVVQDAQGHELRPRAVSPGAVAVNHPNTIVPDYLFASLIITCQDAVHRDIAKFMLTLRRLQDPSGASNGGGIRLCGPVAPSSAFAERVKTSAPPTTERSAKIEEVLKHMRELLNQVDDAPSGRISVPPER
jgi:RNA polymerase sigma factor (sigma-70 family)